MFLLKRQIHIKRIFYCLSLFVLFSLLFSAISNARIADLWAQSEHFDGGGQAGRFAFSPNFAVDKTGFVATRAGVYKTVDGAQTWEANNSGLPVNRTLYFNFFASISISPQFANDSTLFVASPGFGIYKSIDAGSTWNPVNTDDRFNRLAQVAVSPNYGSDQTVIIATAYPRQNYSSDVHQCPKLLSDLAKSTDGGNTWQYLNIGFLPDLFGVSDLAFSPDYANDKTIIFVGPTLTEVMPCSSTSSFGGIFKSNDSGETWSFYAIPSDGNRVAFSPNFSIDKTIFVNLQSTEEFFNSTIVKSVDGGNTWQASGYGLVPSGLGSIAVSPNYLNDGVVYTTITEGVFFSIDNGTSWQPLWNGLTFGTNFCTKMTALALSPNYRIDHRLFSGIGEGCGGLWDYFITGPVALVSPGSNVSVDLGNFASINFTSVDSAGKVIVTVTSEAPVPPVGFAIYRTPENGSYYNLNATFSHSGPITVTIPYDPASVSDPRLYHYDNTTNDWVDVTTSVDTTIFTVTGIVNSLSPFALGTPLTSVTPINFLGFKNPIKNNGANVFKLGRSLPVKFQLTYSNGSFVSNKIAKLFVAPIFDGVAGTEQPAVSKNKNDVGNTFRYDSIANQYIFNLDTKTLYAGTWQIRVSLDDGSSHSAIIFISSR